jgi:hypothetical protein
MQMLNHVMLLQSRSRQVGIDTARSLDKTNRGKARQQLIKPPRPRQTTLEPCLASLIEIEG